MKMKQLLITFTAIITFYSASLHAQQGPPKQMMAPPPGVSKITTSDGVTIFPFELISNHIVIPVEVNGEKVRVILDTGKPMEGLILFGSQAAYKLNLPIIGKAPVMSGADGSTILSDLAMGVNFTLPGTDFSQQMVIVLPYDDVRNNMFKDVHGIIGNSIFNHFVTSINYDSMEITLTDPGNFEYTGEGKKVPLEIGMFPEISAEIETVSGKKLPIKMTVDTGFQGAAGLGEKIDGHKILPKKYLEVKAFGLQKEINQRIGRIKGLYIGDLHFTNVLTSFTQDNKPPQSQKNKGILGQGILKRFNLVFDYANKTMILEPNSKFKEPFEFDMAGFQFIRTNNNLIKITHVISNSPAAEAGLKKGCLLETINGKPVERLSKDEVTSILKQEGKEVTLGIKRGEENIIERIVPRRLI